MGYALCIWGCHTTFSDCLHLRECLITVSPQLELYFMVRLTGLEPVRAHAQRILPTPTTFVAHLINDLWSGTSYNHICIKDLGNSSMFSTHLETCVSLSS